MVEPSQYDEAAEHGVRASSLLPDASGGFKSWLARGSHSPPGVPGIP